MAALQLQLPPYEQFDSRSEGENVRWRLENNVFNGCGIANPVQKKLLLLMYGGSDLNDIVDSFDPAILEPVTAVAATDQHPEALAQDVYQRITAAITDHFNPRANTEFQRFLFKQTMQTTPEIDEFYSTLRHQSCPPADENGC